ncbi:MAG TPA: TonB-dependent receptor, partial [Agriterribacter sp.]|nr:TonB-dependent receptor [Agriterribacter sp.]
HQTQEITVGNQTSIDVVMLPGESSELDAVVVVGYGTQKKVTVTGAVAQVKGTELSRSPAVNLSNSLVGRLPGISAVQSSGEPGYDGSRIRIRGTNTLGNSDALIVIDGVPERSGGLERLNPNDIENVSVLKDASAAIYGARAANGVILITTKHGKTGKPQLSYDFNYGIAQPTVIPKMADAVQYAEMANELVIWKDLAEVPDQWSAAWDAFKQTGSYTRSDNGRVVNATYKPDDINKFRDGSDPWGHPNTDWFGDVLKKWSPQVRHNLQINGGSENVKYLASLGYNDQDGYYKNSATGYKQYDMRLNLDAKVNKYINVQLGLTAREEYRFFPTKGAGAIFRMLMRGKPTEQAIWPNGMPGPDIENGENPVVITTNLTGYDRDKRDYFQTNGKVEILIPGIEGLKLTGMAAVDKYIYRGKRWETPWSLYNWDNVSLEDDGKTPKLTRVVRSTFTDPRLRTADENKLNILLGALLNYDRTIKDDHTVNVLVGINRETINDDYFSAFRRYFISTAVDQMFAGGDAEKDNNGGAYERARLSYFGRVGYNFREKYIAEFVWRYDGSYIFPEDSRFGFFPGVLVGWNISEENFFSENVPFINYLKLRGSYGQMGNDQVYFNGNLQEYQYLSTYGFNSYIIDRSLSKTLFETRVPNPDFTWEVANNSNIGLEGSALDRRLSFELEYFINKRDQILIQKQGSTPASAGIGSLLPPVNLGKLSNKGWEFKLGYSDYLGGLRFSVGINGGYAKNKIDFWDEIPGAPEWQKSTGASFGSNGVNYLAYEYDGVFVDQADIDKNTLDYSGLVGELRPGDMKYKDIDGNNIIDQDDRTRLKKNRDPLFTGGISINLQYKDFDLSVLFQGATGGLLFFGTESGSIGNYLEYSYNNRWSIEKPSSVDPRSANRGDQYYSGLNTYWLRSSNYLRVKNIELGYNLPDRLTKKAGINNFRVYINALNLLTFDKMKIYDPEATSGSGQYYPQSRIINGGFRIIF